MQLGARRCINQIHILSLVRLPTSHSSLPPSFATHNATHNRAVLHILARTYGCARFSGTSILPLTHVRGQSYSYSHALLAGTQSAEPRENSFHGGSLFPRAWRGQQRHRNGDEEGRPEKRRILPAF